MDEKELQAVVEAMNQLREGGEISAETLAKLGGTTQNVNKALEGYTKKLLGATSAVGSMAKQVAEGEGSFRSLGGAISGLTSVVGKLASAIPLVGGAAKALAEGVGEAAKFVLEQLDTMAKNYQTLGDASAGAADGVDGLLRQFNQLGNFSLPAFTKAVKANTQGLAALAGTAGLGAEELSKVSGALTTGDTARKFLKLGISLDSVGEATAQYLADSARYGITQGATTEQLTKKTQDYIVEVDKIARLTGQTREAQAREAQKSLLDARFRARMAEMTANGQREQAEQLRLYVEGLGGAAGDAARALVTGIPLTKEAAAANLFANDAIRENTQAIQEGKKATVAIADTQQALADGTDRFGKQIQYAGDQFGGVAIQAYDAKVMIAEQNKLMAEGMTREQAIAEIQRKQAEAAGKTTTELTDAQLATAGASKNLQSLGFSLATYAVPAVNKFAGALEKVTGYIDKQFGVGGRRSTPTGVDRGVPGGPRQTPQAPEEVRRVGAGTAREKAEQYYGKKITDEEYDKLVRATHAEAAAGKQASQREQAMIMASILNRAREHEKGIIGALTAKNQFQAVTGTRANNNQPSRQYLQGPDQARRQSIEGATDLLVNISKQQKNFTAASAAAYGPGTNIGYRNKMLAEGGQQIGGTIFQSAFPGATDREITGPRDKYQTSLNGVSYDAAGRGIQTQGQQTQSQPAEKSALNLMAQHLAQIEYNTRNSARAQEKTNRLVS